MRFFIFFAVLLLLPVSVSAIYVSVDVLGAVIFIDSPPEKVLPFLGVRFSFVPELRYYDIDKSHDIWHAKDPSSYIIPLSPWVQYYARNNISLGLIYRTDEEMYPENLDKDVWQNADYTLWSGYGDCEDLAIVGVSIDIAKGRKAVVVGGYVTLDNGLRIRDFWEEVAVDGIKTIKPTNPALQTQKELRLEPEFMFNDMIQWQRYNENWYIN